MLTGQGDATLLLQALIDADLPPGTAAFGWIYDPEVLEQCFDAGIGRSIDVSLGGKADPTLGKAINHQYKTSMPIFTKVDTISHETGGGPIEATATVRVLTDGKFSARENSVGWSPGSSRNMGKMARLEIGGIDVLVNAVRSQVFDEGAFTLAGIDVNAYQIIGVKSSTHFRAGWAPISRAILTADEPGWTSNDLYVFEPMRCKKQRSLWPVDASANYPENDVGGATECISEARPRM